jgi:LEA14-like dessication related protein
MRALVLALCLVACSKPKPPTITPEKGQVTSVTPFGVDLDLTLGVDNPNKVSLPVQGVTAKVMLDGKIDMGTVTSDKAIDLPAGKKTSMTVPVSVKWNDFPAIMQLAAQSKDVPYSVDGKVKLGGALLNVEVPFTMTGTITHDELVKATLKSIPKIPGLPNLIQPR